MAITTTCCADYQEIKDLCAKYGLRINNDTIYQQRLFGKSGIYEVTDEPCYACTNEYWSERRLKQLKEDIQYIDERYGRVSLKIVQYDDIDTRVSLMTLSECYGWRKRDIIVSA